MVTPDNIQGFQVFESLANLKPLPLETITISGFAGTFELLKLLRVEELNRMNNSRETAIVCSGKGLKWWVFQNPGKPCREPKITFFYAP